MTAPSRDALDRKLAELLREDVGEGDVTTEWTVDPRARAAGTLIARSACVVSGLPVARRTFELQEGGISWDEKVSAGSRVAAGSILARLEGVARALLTAERVALNLIQRMCGIATATRRYVDAVEGTGCRILDTRKTAPGLRLFDRMAVADGGGENHRAGLFDQVLIKDNHRRLAGGVAAAVREARRRAPSGMRVEVEVESESELSEAIASEADIVLIDNQSPATVARWVAIARRAKRPPLVEASGGITLETVRAYAEAGADRVSVGALTHSVAAADISLELEAETA